MGEIDGTMPRRGGTTGDFDGSVGDFQGTAGEFQGAMGLIAASMSLREATMPEFEARMRSREASMTQLGPLIRSDEAWVDRRFRGYPWPAWIDASPDSAGRTDGQFGHLTVADSTKQEAD